MVLSPREKLLIGLLGAFVVGLVLYFGVGSMRGRLAELHAQVQTREALVQKSSVLQMELQRLRQSDQSNRGAPRSRSLIGYVEQLAQQVGVRDRIQLNALPKDSATGLQGLEVKVNNLSLDEAMKLLYTMEDADYRLVIDQFELSPSFRDKDLLRLSMRVLSQE